MKNFNTFVKSILKQYYKDIHLTQLTRTCKYINKYYNYFDQSDADIFYAKITFLVHLDKVLKASQENIENWDMQSLKITNHAYKFRANNEILDKIIISSLIISSKHYFDDLIYSADFKDANHHSINYTINKINTWEKEVLKIIDYRLEMKLDDILYLFNKDNMPKINLSGIPEFDNSLAKEHNLVRSALKKIAEESKYSNQIKTSSVKNITQNTLPGKQKFGLEQNNLNSMDKDIGPLSPNDAGC